MSFFENESDDGYTRYSSGYGYEQDSRSYEGYSAYESDDGYYDYTPPPPPRKQKSRSSGKRYANESSRLPSKISSHGEKVIIIDPNAHAWGAYDAGGNLQRSGIATAGAKWCPDIGRSCRTKAGTFRIFSLGNSSCYSRKYPLGRGGAPMPYCMFFNGGQGIHGSTQLANANLSHGCVRIRTSDAQWLRYNFAGVGTKVVVRAY